MRARNDNQRFPPILVLRFLRACIYGNASTFYCSLSNSEFSELEELGNRFHLEAWFYRFLYKDLSEEKCAKYRKKYQARQVKALMLTQELKRLYQVLEANNLRFVPIKGIDLAYRLYPDTALRTFGDWDIWFHPDDCNRVQTVLEQDNWKTYQHYNTIDDIDRTIRESTGHHFSPFFRGEHMLEPHYTLSHFTGIDMHELWDYTDEISPGHTQRILSPELNLLMLTRHAASRSYFHVQLPRLLSDAAMVMQNELVDFAKLRELTNRWHLPYSCDLLAAFPEFFPKDVLSMFKANPNNTTTFRKLFELQREMEKTNSVALLMGMSDVHRCNPAASLMGYLRFLYPNKIRLIYRLPHNKSWGRVVWSYICYLFSRSWLTLKWIYKRKLFRTYAQLVANIESM